MLFRSPTAYSLIKMQLQGATEKRAACLARVVMNDLERRLLQRQQANSFETFIVAVILLACVERMCWLFRTWEEETPPAPSVQANMGPTTNAESAAEPSHQQHTSDATLAQALQSASESATPNALLSTGTRNRKWPFDKPPEYYSQQGERFSDILNMLLKMRGVPPKPVARSSDGQLVMWGEDMDNLVREWYEGIAVTMDGLAERAGASFVGEDASEWELKFVGKIIGV